MDRNLFSARLFTARTQRRISVGALATGRALLKHANQKGACWPSAERLSTVSGNAVRCVWRHLTELVLEGFIERLNRGRNPRTGRFHSNLYSLRTPRPAPCATPAPKPSTGLLRKSAAEALPMLDRALKAIYLRRGWVYPDG